MSMSMGMDLCMCMEMHLVLLIDAVVLPEVAGRPLLVLRLGEHLLARGRRAAVEVLRVEVHLCVHAHAHGHEYGP